MRPDPHTYTDSALPDAIRATYGLAAAYAIALSVSPVYAVPVFAWALDKALDAAIVDGEEAARWAGRKAAAMAQAAIRQVRQALAAARAWWRSL